MLPDELRLALRASARERGLSEAEVIRQAIAEAVTRRGRRPPFRTFSSDAPPIDWNRDDYLEGLGDW